MAVAYGCQWLIIGGSIVACWIKALDVPSSPALVESMDFVALDLKFCGFSESQ